MCMYPHWGMGSYVYVSSLGNGVSIGIRVVDIDPVSSIVEGPVFIFNPFITRQETDWTVGQTSQPKSQHSLLDCGFTFYRPNLH